MELPHLVPVEKAARIIAEGVAKGRREIIIPWQMALIARVLGLLPTVCWCMSWPDRRRG